MAINSINNQVITDRYALYNGDCIQVLPSIPDESIGFAVYSPPFGIENLVYSSADEDLSNCPNREDFLAHYGFLIEQMARVTKKGRVNAVHCMDTPGRGTGVVDDFPGDVIRLHQAHGFDFVGRHFIWKEPLSVAIRTRALHLRHGQLVKDSALCGPASADQLLLFRKRGENKEPITHPLGLSNYAGERRPPEGYEEKYRKWIDDKTNRLSQWIWRQYASSFWDDIRVSRTLPYKEARDPEDEKHCHPLQLDVIERCLVMWSNPNDTVLTPFLGVGSEAYQAVRMNRRAIGIELKLSYFHQACRNVASALDIQSEDQMTLEFQSDEPIEEAEL